MGEVDEVCGACMGHRWLPFLVDKEDGRKPMAEMRPCYSCNKEGSLAIGITLIEPKENVA